MNKEKTDKKLQEENKKENKKEPEIDEGLELDYLDACHSGKCAI